MGERLVMCDECRNKFKKSELVHPTKTTKYCKPCAEKREIRMKEQNELYNTIKELFGIEYVTPSFKKQIKDFRQQYGFTLQGINLTLRYCSLQPGIRFDSKIGLGIVPYKYEDAKKDFLRKEQMKKDMLNNPAPTQSVKKLTINIKTRNKYLEGKLINLEEI